MTTPSGAYTNSLSELPAPKHGVGRIVSAMQDNGFEVRHEENLREHYAKTLKAWGDNLDAHWNEAVREVGLGTARVWRLYMAGSALAFESNRMGVNQVLAVKPGARGAPRFILGCPKGRTAGLAEVWTNDRHMLAAAPRFGAV